MNWRITKYEGANGCWYRWGDRSWRECERRLLTRLFGGTFGVLRIGDGSGRDCVGKGEFWEAYGRRRWPGAWGILWEEAGVVEVRMYRPVKMVRTFNRIPSGGTEDVWIWIRQRAISEGDLSDLESHFPWILVDGVEEVNQGREACWEIITMDSLSKASGSAMKSAIEELGKPFFENRQKRIGEGLRWVLSGVLLAQIIIGLSPGSEKETPTASAINYALVDEQGEQLWNSIREWNNDIEMIKRHLWGWEEGVRFIEGMNYNWSTYESGVDRLASESDWGIMLGFEGKRIEGEFWEEVKRHYEREGVRLDLKQKQGLEYEIKIEYRENQQASNGELGIVYRA